MRSIFIKNELLSVSTLENEGLQFFGNGKRKFLIVIQKEENNEINIEFLKKILNAKKVVLEEDVFLLPVNDVYLSISQLKKNTAIEQIIFFEVSPNQFGLNINLPKYNTVEINGLTIMQADSISKIEKNESLKRSLWGCLKDWPVLDF